MMSALTATAVGHAHSRQWTQLQQLPPLRSQEHRKPQAVSRGSWCRAVQLKALRCPALK